MRASFLLLFLILVTPAVAMAQARPAPRFRAAINLGVQASDTTLSQSFSTTKNFEATPIVVSASLKRGVWFDAGVLVRLAGRVGVAASVSNLSRTESADVTARLPHPFFFNQPRSVAGAAPLRHRETALHFQGSVLVRSSRRFDITVTGGPSIFSVAQNLVTDVTYTEEYPFDVAAFASAASTRVTRTVSGFNAGADATWRLSPRFGVGALVRYTRASTTLAVSQENSTNLDVGGIQVGGGLRLGL